MRVHEFASEFWLPRKREEVFEFFSDAANLEAITPPWPKFQTATSAKIDMHAGTVIDYRLRVHGIPLR